MRCDEEDGNIRRGNVNGKAHILQLKNRLETVIGDLFLFVTSYSPLIET